jgi:hypothetical protein
MPSKVQTQPLMTRRAQAICAVFLSAAVPFLTMPLDAFGQNQCQPPITASKQLTIPFQLTGSKRCTFLFRVIWSDSETEDTLGGTIPKQREGAVNIVDPCTQPPTAYRIAYMNITED